MCRVLSLHSLLGSPRHLHTFPTRRSSDLGDWKVSETGIAEQYTLTFEPAKESKNASCKIEVSFPETDRFDTKARDRKSTRLNSSHANISYAVFCLKKKNSL